MRDKKILFSVFAFLLLIVPTATAQFNFPSPVGYVNDFAGLLPDAGLIDATLAEYERNTTIEIAVVTIEALPEDHTTATYAVELFQEWGIGKEEEDNGILVLIVKDGEPGSRMRIELGYGIQGYVTGAESGRILDEALPSYEAGDYEAAVATILVGLSRELEGYVPGEYYYPEPDYEGLLIEMLPVIIIFAFILISVAASAASRCEHCGGKLECSGDHCVCTKCGRRSKKRSWEWLLLLPLVMGGRGGGGGGFGGFGGGGSGGGGAGR